MSLIDKFKTMFVEELDDEDVIQKKVIQVKIPNPEEVKPVEKKPSFIDEEEEEELPVEPVKIEEVKEKPKQPMKNFFEDDDLTDFDTFTPEKPKVIKQEYTYKKTETTVSPVITGYGIKRDEPRKKAFTPTPIISPVYGVLDKNYRKDEIRARKGSSIRNHEEDRVNVDNIRKKAYGTLEDELENELSGSRSNISDTLVEDFMDEDTSAKEPIDIFEEVKNDEEDDFLSEFKDDSSKLVEDELNKDYDKYESEIKKNMTKEYSDDDLFNLIDSMYRKKDGE